jgi:hypothetical protein
VVWIFGFLVQNTHTQKSCVIWRKKSKLHTDKSGRVIQ